MAKKRTSLDSLLGAAKELPPPEAEPAAESEPGGRTTAKAKNQPSAKGTGNEFAGTGAGAGKTATIKQTVYLPPAIHEQLRQLAFEERKKMHDYLVEGLDRVFKNRGLKSYAELSGESRRR